MNHLQLRERREANEFAEDEFRRVKRAKLETERARAQSSHHSGGTNEDRERDRARANRASAAASRAKIICYSQELEKRTDRLEAERNEERIRADRAARRLAQLGKELHTLKMVVRGIWAMKEHRTCTYLVDSNAMFLLGSSQGELEGSFTESEETNSNGIVGSPTDVALRGPPDLDTGSRLSEYEPERLHPEYSLSAHHQTQFRDGLMPDQSMTKSRAATVPRARKSASLWNLVHP